jgi:hypothetical protein
VQLARLAAYKAVHGDCWVPAAWAEDPRLGRWVAAQRTHKKKLDRGEPCSGMTAARAAKLTALGVDWKASSYDSLNNGVWEAQLARLAAYKAEHGDCSVPKCWAEDLRLGKWVSNQRAYKRKLDRGEPSQGMTAARAARLEALGFAWDPPHRGGKPKGVEWEAQLARLVVYKAAHGDCKVPQGWAEDPRLARWVNHQWQYKQNLDRGDPCQGMTAARAARLEALGFVWDLLPRYHPRRG